MDRPNPYDAEIEICEHLIAYLTKKKIEHGLIPAEDESISELQKVVSNQDNKVAL